MIKIYFDGTLLDSDNYVNISNNFKPFEQTFFLGSSAANTMNIEIPSNCIEDIPSLVTIKIDEELYANLIVDSYEFKDNNILTLNLVDKMVNFNFNYDASTIVPCTIKQILEDICSKAGVELGTNSFTNDSIIINYYDSRLTAREYLSYIAELNGGYARIEKDGKLYLKKYNNDPFNININTCENYKIGEKHKIERVVFDNGLLKYQTSSDEELETLYLDSSNVYITSQEIFYNIANNILNFEYYCFSTSNCEINSNIMGGDIINFTDGTNNYPTIAQYSLNYNGDWIGGYEFNIESQKQQETKIISNEENIKNLYVELNRNENKLNITIEDVTTLSNQTSQNSSKITELELTTSEIRSEIGDVTDITITQEGTNLLEFENINISEPINVNIHPINTDIAYLYPADWLYPSDNLYAKDRTIEFKNITTNETFTYLIPDDLRYCNGTYDELILDYENRICKIIKRVGINNSTGINYILDEEIIKNYDYPEINLTTGDYEIKVLGYSDAYMKIRLMSQNMYTSQFATIAQLNSSLTQTRNSITASVNEQITLINDEIETISGDLSLKIDRDDNDRIVSMLNASADIIKLASGRLIIESGNFQLNSSGNMICNGGTIGGWTINSLGLTNGVVKLNSDGSSTIYTVADLIIIRNYIMGLAGFDLSEAMLQHYDLNGDGSVDIMDFIRLQNLIGITA